MSITCMCLYSELQNNQVQFVHAKESSSTSSSHPISNLVLSLITYVPTRKYLRRWYTEKYLFLLFIVQIRPRLLCSDNGSQEVLEEQKAEYPPYGCQRSWTRMDENSTGPEKWRIRAYTHQ